MFRLAAFQLKAFKMSSVQLENSSQSSGGAPSSAQMTGIGYWRAMSVTTSQRPWALWRSTSPVMMSTIVVRSRGVALGVKALHTSRRSRWCSSPLRLRMLAATRSQSGPEVMPCAARNIP